MAKLDDFPIGRLKFLTDDTESKMEAISKSRQEIEIIEDCVKCQRLQIESNEAETIEIILEFLRSS